MILVGQAEAGQSGLALADVASFIPRRINPDSSADFSLSIEASVIDHIFVGFALDTTAGYSTLWPSHSSRSPRLFGICSRSVLRVPCSFSAVPPRRCKRSQGTHRKFSKSYDRVNSSN